MEASQQQTQPCTDPRRLGQVSTFSGDHDPDIICILHPNSPAAHEAVAATARSTPQHILQQDRMNDESLDTAALDIALRFSSRVHDDERGFVFGRNLLRSDVLLTTETTEKRVSNLHFRIYCNNDGIIMLHDTSTNGTVVDNERIKGGTRMLVPGSVVQVIKGDPASNIEVRFIVRIPSREGCERQYTENLRRYLERRDKSQTPRTRENSTQPSLQLAVAHATHGMHWSGGDKYNVTGKIGKGAFAIVYTLATKQHGVVYAAKELDKRRFMKHGVLDPKVDNEMRIMRDLKHPNIVQYIDHHEHERWIYIIMEFVPCGDLLTYFQSLHTIPEHIGQQVAHQVVHALHYLHKRRITHRDIKPDNILISSIEPLRVKVSDFGLSKVVQEEETFLKTFCGTLLYCAPEIYPGYDTYRRGEARKRRRFGDPPPKTTPYNQSVDTWSLGAVLFHVMAGSPPFMASGENQGAPMLEMIMTTYPNYDELRVAGLSEDAVDFVRRLLDRDPLSRPKERESLRHPWLSEVENAIEYEDDDMQSEDGDALSDIGEDEEEELDASQLSIHDEQERQDSFGRDEMTQSKRQRVSYLPREILYPSLPDLESYNKDGSAGAETTPRRLFGEISQPALRSSHALGVSMKAYDGDDFSGRDFLSSAGESIISNCDSLNSIMSLPEFPLAGSAPSLMGAENMVRQMHMDSSLPATSPNHTQGIETPARQTSLADENKGLADGDRSAAGHPSVNDTTPKAFNLKRRIQIPIPDTGRSQLPTPDIASEASREQCRRASPEVECAGSHFATEEIDSELAVTLDAYTGKEISGRLTSQHSVRMDHVPEQEPGVINNPRTLPITRIHEPRPLLGKLTSLPGSIFDMTIDLEDRMTSWGRGPQATICHPDPMDTRIPAYALEVTFWCPAIETKMTAGDDWRSVPEVMAILSTQTRSCLWVNDIELRSGEYSRRKGYEYGKLYTGDVITVYKRRNKFLKLQCEFYHGASARPRPDEEKGFLIRRISNSKEDLRENGLPVQKNGEQER